MKRSWLRLGVLLLVMSASSAVPGCATEDEDDASGADSGTDDDSGGGGDNDGGEDDNGDDEGRFRRVELVNTDDGAQRMGVDTVNGIRCIDATHCAVATRNLNDGGALYVMTDGRTLEPVLSAGLGLPDQADFLGIDDTGAGWIARLDISSPFVLASGDPSAASSWSVVAVGTNDSDEDFTVLNSQELVRAGSSGGWIYAYTGVLWHTAAPGPGPTAAWTGRWSPGRNPPFPEDYAERKRQDPTLCDSDPAVAIEPDMTHLGFVSPDLRTIIFPAGARNQPGTDLPGVCISRDAGENFHQLPFPDIGVEEIGPLAVHCLDADRCWAFNGVTFDGAPAYVYVSTNVSGATPTWQRATLPREADDDQPRAISFAPDGRRGWLVGEDALVWTTTDGGATWTDIAGELAAVAGEIDWTSVFAVDGERVWLGGANGVLVTQR